MAYAAVRGHLKVMRSLLERQADVNLADSGGNSPLIHAAMRGRTDAVRLLLEPGGKVDAASKSWLDPLMAAAWEGHTSVATDLLKRGADATLVNAEGRSARMLAESEGHRAIVELLTARRAADPRVRVLILDGYSNHDWRLTTSLIRGILEPTGLFTVDGVHGAADPRRAGLG